MRRQVGADTMDLDNIGGVVHYSLYTPRTLDLEDIQEAVYGAGYTLTGIEFLVDGRTVSRPCDTCDREVVFLELDETGQLIELTGKIPAGLHARVEGALSSWDGEHPRLEVRDYTLIE